MTPGRALTDPIESVPGVTRDEGEAFRRLGVPSVAHLVQHLPFRHERVEPEAPIAELAADALVTARGEITDTAVRGPARRRRFQAVLADESGRLDLVWFNQPYLQRRVKPGMRLVVRGKSKRVGRTLQLANPQWELAEGPPKEAGSPVPLGRGPELRPIYPATEDLPSRAIGRAVRAVLDDTLPLIEDHLPEDLRRRHGLAPLRDAYRMVHAPQTEDEAADGRRRLVYDDLLLVQLGVQMKRAAFRRTRRAPALALTAEIDTKIRARFPFALTAGQEAVVAEIADDLQRTEPAMRLIQGDVGSGKTVVALYALLMAVASGRQGALMAPTELLAEQHYASISSMLTGSRVRMELLTGSLNAAEREAARDRIGAGEADIVLGTHALVSEGVSFKDLGVAVVDEQHRFGVRQRAALRARSADPTTAPHTLVMTATPIPRTLALTVFGDLDVSTLKGLPPGRSPVSTRWLTPDRADEAYGFARARIAAGERVYVVVPAVEPESAEPSLGLAQRPSPVAGPGRGPGGGPLGGPGADAGPSPSSGWENTAPAIRDVRSTVRSLEAGAFAGLRVGSLHGRLNRESRDRVMARFRAGRLDALVATTVIEVGVDVPDATVIIIENADRFGLAQLHQLRGRVGRGDKPSACLLVAEAATDDARRRLEAMVATTDGFALAEVDLELRGPGEVAGARQSGAAGLRIATLPRDLDTLLLARRDARAWVDASPALDRPEDALARSRMLKTYGGALGLIDRA